MVKSYEEYKKQYGNNWMVYMESDIISDHFRRKYQTLENNQNMSLYKKLKLRYLRWKALVKTENNT